MVARGGNRWDMTRTNRLQHHRPQYYRKDGNKYKLVIGNRENFVAQEREKFIIRDITGFRVNNVKPPPFFLVLVGTTTGTVMRLQRLYEQIRKESHEKENAEKRKAKEWSHKSASEEVPQKSLEKTQETRLMIVDRPSDDKLFDLTNEDHDGPEAPPTVRRTPVGLALVPRTPLGLPFVMGAPVAPSAEPRVATVPRTPVGLPFVMGAPNQDPSKQSRTCTYGPWILEQPCILLKQKGFHGVMQQPQAKRMKVQVSCEIPLSVDNAGFPRA